MKHCEIEGCSKVARSGSAKYCEMHYYRLRRTGDPNSRTNSSVSVNENAFTQWSNDMAWALGLLWTDGNVSKNTVSLVSKDVDLIEEVAKVISLRGGIYPKDQGKYSIITFRSTNVVERLYELGMTENKSLTIGWPNSIPELHEHAFVRGVIDGDGCIVIQPHRTGPRPACRIQIVSGSLEFANQLRDCFIRHGMTPTITVDSSERRKNPLYTVRLSSESNIRKAFSWLYPDGDCPRLMRKYIKLATWCALPKPKLGRRLSDSRNLVTSTHQ